MARTSAQVWLTSIGSGITADGVTITVVPIGALLVAVVVVAAVVRWTLPDPVDDLPAFVISTAGAHGVVGRRGRGRGRHRRRRHLAGSGRRGRLRRRGTRRWPRRRRPTRGRRRVVVHRQRPRPPRRACWVVGGAGDADRRRGARRRAPAGPSRSRRRSLGPARSRAWAVASPWRPGPCSRCRTSCCGPQPLSSAPVSRSAPTPSVDLTGAQLGAVPGFPVLAALPSPGEFPGWVFLLGLVPLAAGAVAGWRAVSGRSRGAQVPGRGGCRRRCRGRFHARRPDRRFGRGDRTGPHGTDRTGRPHLAARRRARHGGGRWDRGGPRALSWRACPPVLPRTRRRTRPVWSFSSLAAARICKP